MTEKRCILVGRGPSADALTWPAPCPVMAVSSGIYKIPAVHPPEHFATLDTIKYFQAGLWPDAKISWSFDDQAEPWPFWSYEIIQKHVTTERIKSSTYRRLPPEVIDAIPPQHRDAFARELITNTHVFGFQPSWGDFSNVRGWNVDRRYPPNFTPQEDPILGLGRCNNSLLMAVQVAHQLGYEHLIFAGCDLHQDHHHLARQRLLEWWPVAESHGLQWSCLTDESYLAGTLPVQELTHAA